MAVSIPSGQDILMTVKLPAGLTGWPGPPAWAPTAPDQATVELIADTGQMQAKLTAYGNSSVLVTCLDLAGNEDFVVDDTAGMPPTPVTITLQ